VLVASRSEDGSAERCSFPADAFEEVVLSGLREVEPPDDRPAGRAGACAERVADLRRRLAAAEDLLVRRPSDAMARAAQKLEARLREAEADLRKARAEEATPLSVAWDDCKSLLDVAAEGVESRLRLRAAIRRVVGRIECHFSAQNCKERFAFVEVSFTGGGHRTYIMRHHGGTSGREASTTYTTTRLPLGEVWRRYRAGENIPLD
jgi:hypothetical protein